MMYRFACFQFRRTFIPRVGRPYDPVCFVYIAKMYYICDPNPRSEKERERRREGKMKEKEGGFPLSRDCCVF